MIYYEESITSEIYYYIRLLHELHELHVLHELHDYTCFSPKFSKHRAHIK